jgi:vacuolar protein sorting-associated protein 18
VPEIPIFDLGRVQYAINAPLVSLVVCSDILVMGLSSNVLILIELAHPTQVLRIPIQSKGEFTLYKLFMDPSGRHIIVTSQQGENWYFFRSWKKPRQLKSFNKMVIESVAWSKAALLSSSRPTSTREMLIGTRSGVIYEAILDAEEDFFKSQERYLQPVFSLPERHPICGIKVDFFPPGDPRRALVVVTTPSRIYQFVGTLDRRSEEGGRVFSALFANYRETAPSK